MDILDGRKLILASASPRRHQLLKELHLPFETRLRPIEEHYPENLPVMDVAEYLAKLKSTAFYYDLKEDEIIITSDTIVLLGNQIMGKPNNRQEAIEMLKKLSGKPHLVLTAVCLSSKNKQLCFTEKTKVFFKPLTQAEILFYIDTYKPFDKAGAYGIQEWIGSIGIEKIEGSYYTVVGLPVARLYEELKMF